MEGKVPSFGECTNQWWWIERRMKINLMELYKSSCWDLGKLFRDCVAFRAETEYHHYCLLFIVPCSFLMTLNLDGRIYLLVFQLLSLVSGPWGGGLFVDLSILYMMVSMETSFLLGIQYTQTNETWNRKRLCPHTVSFASSRIKLLRIAWDSKVYMSFFLVEMHLPCCDR